MLRSGLKLLFAAVGLLITLSNASAIACQPIFKYAEFLPACQIPAATLDEEVLVVKIQDQARRVSSITTGGRNELRMGVVDLDIRPGAKPIYLVLSSFYPVIWRLNGATESLSRVVALGSMKDGADAVGVIGVPRAKVEFPAPDMTTYAQGEITVGQLRPSMCDGVAKACVPESFLFHYPTSPSDPSAVIVRRTRPMLSARGAVFVGQSQQIESANFKTVEPGPLPAAYLDVPKIIERPEADPHSRVSIRPDGVGTLNDELVLLAPDDVVSPMKPAPYAVAPGAAGLRQLIDKGVLFDDRSQEFQVAFANWNEARSKPYRSRFDPAFVFPNPSIKHYIAQPLTEIPASDFGRFLLADGVPIPKHKPDPLNAFCFAYVSGAQAGKEDCNPTTRLSGAAVSGANGDSLDIQKARLDDLRWFEEATPDELARVRASPAGEFDLKETTTSRRKFLRSPGPTCRLMDMPDNVFSAALTIYAGRRERAGENGTPVIEASRTSRLDVVVQRPGDVLLYLNSEVGAQWHVSAGKGTRIVGILLRDRSGSVVEKPDGVAVQWIGDILSFPTRSGTDCGAYWPPQNGQLGGPAPLLIDKSLAAMTGKGLDLYVARQMPRDTGSNENENTWQSRTDIKQFTTFVVE